MAKVKDMTEGKPFPLIVSFGVPLMLGYIFQQLYGLVDSAVVGRLIGVDAFAAVGASGFMSWMVISIVLGFTQGFGVLYAQKFGSKEEAGVRKAVAMSIWLSAALGIILTVLSLIFTKSILKVIQTPPEILNDTVLYLNWILSGTLIMTFYNMAASVLRALGDSKTPLYGVIISSVLNVILDFVFVAGFGMGVDGAAIATVAAQLVSLIFCIMKLRKVELFRFQKSDFAFDRPMVKELLRLGFPLAFRNAVISAGGLVVQYVINGYGKIFVAGTAAPRKYFGFMDMIAGAIDGAIATFTGQNFGAGKMKRIKEGMRCVRWIGLVSSCVIAGLIILLGEGLVRLLVIGEPEQIEELVSIGYQNFIAMAVCLPMLYMLYIHRSGLQGMGNSIIPMLSGFVELGLKIFAVLYLPAWIGRKGVYFSDGLGWIGAGVLLIVAYNVVYRKRCREHS